jgi:hypothetical protein
MAAQRRSSGQMKRGGGRKRPAGFLDSLNFIASLRQFDHSQFFRDFRGRVNMFFQALF